MADVSVNGVVIDKQRLSEEIDLLKEVGAPHAKRRATQALIIRQLLLDELQVKGIQTTKDSEEEHFAQLVLENTPDIVIDDADCQRFYQQDTQRFKTAPLMVVRHILFAAAKDDIVGRGEQKAKAEALLEKIQSADNQLAAFIDHVGVSRCPSKSEQGLLGELSAGQTVPEFERQVFMLEEGLAPHPVETRYGYHLVYVDKKQAGQTMPLEMCIDKIRTYLMERRKRQAISEYLHQLAEKADISGFTLQIEQENIVL